MKTLTTQECGVYLSEWDDDWSAEGFRPVETTVQELASLNAGTVCGEISVNEDTREMQEWYTNDYKGFIGG